MPNGELIYRAAENGNNYLYTKKRDGSEKRKFLEQPILDIVGVSPDGRWVSVGVRNDQDQEHTARAVAYPTAGGKPVLICITLCLAFWSQDGKYMVLEFGVKGENQSAALLPLKPTGLPELPAEGYANIEQVRASAKNKLVPVGVDSAINPQKYSYKRITIRRNIYRVPTM